MASIVVVDSPAASPTNIIFSKTCKAKDSPTCSGKFSATIGVTIGAPAKILLALRTNFDCLASLSLICAAVAETMANAGNVKAEICLDLSSAVNSL